ncbi:DUF2958 domain-containing protein [Fredinandcohnia humi]
MLKLWTTALAESTPKLYETEQIPAEEKIVTAKFFSITSSHTWYVVEAEEQDGDVLFFGFVDVGDWNSEWGYFSLSELESVNGLYRVPIIERDLYFNPTKFSELKINA